MKTFPVRLTPGQDLRPALEASWKFAREAGAVTGHHYLEAGNEPRLWGEFVGWTQEDRFDYELAGAPACWATILAVCWTSLGGIWLLLCC